MIKNSEEKGYVLVEYRDILKGIKVAADLHNEKVELLFKNLFTDFDVEDEIIEDINYKKIKKDSRIISFLKEHVGITEYETINYDILKDALTRATYEFNHEMKNKLYSYFRKFVDNEISGISNEVLIEDIKNDVYLFEYIKKYNSFSDYVEMKKNENEQIREKIKVNR